MSVEVDAVVVGNAIVDVIARVSEDFITEQAMTKGSMALIDEVRANELYENIRDDCTVASGGSVANTAAGIASFGGSTSYLGKVATDELGAIFIEDMLGLGVHIGFEESSNGPSTARCMIMVTPDAQRTLNTYLGISALLEPADVDPELIEAGKVLFCEGYLWDVESAKEAIRKAMRIAKAAGRSVSLTLSDTFCIERHYDEFRSLVSADVDILFANEAELTTLYRCDFDEAVSRVRDEVALAFVTRSAKGSIVVDQGSITEVPAKVVESLVDTTGAGDQYAAGALFGVTHGFSPVSAAELGSAAAAEVISHMGPRPQIALKTLLPDAS